MMDITHGVSRHAELAEEIAKRMKLHEAIGQAVSRRLEKALVLAVPAMISPLPNRAFVPATITHSAKHHA